MKRNYGVADRNSYRIAIIVGWLIIAASLLAAMLAIVSDEVTRVQRIGVPLTMMVPLAGASFLTFKARERLNNLGANQVETSDGIIDRE